MKVEDLELWGPRRLPASLRSQKRVAASRTLSRAHGSRVNPTLRGPGGCRDRGLRGPGAARGFRAAGPRVGWGGELEAGRRA